MKCKKHPKYKGILKPRVPCEACWYLWARAHWYASVERSETDKIKELVRD